MIPRRSYLLISIAAVVFLFCFHGSFSAGAFEDTLSKSRSEDLQPRPKPRVPAELKKIDIPASQEVLKELPEEVSPFEEYARDKGAKLKQFGYDLFRGVPSTFAPVDAVPVGPDYVLGPGDQLVISVWGKVMDEYSLQLDREGKVNFPLAGILNLAGLTFSEAKKFLELEMSRYYRPSEVKMNVSMGALRSLRVFVVGKAQRPGSYTLSSLSTLVNALFAAGGPGKVGTMRDIQVKRGGSTVAHFDLYDFLLRGDKTNDIRLQPEDVIFIPPAGPLAGIAGSVKAPGIYELKGESTVKELIDMAGGLNDIAFKGRLQIDRIVDNNKDVVIESNLDDPASVAMRLQPGDIVSVFSVVSDTGFVRLSGAVQREGFYGIGSGMTVKDLMAMAGGLKYYAYTEEAELTRVTPTQGGPVTEKIKINIKKALEGDSKDDIELKKDDFLLVRPVPQWELYRTVRISGEVRFQGTYTILKGETLSSLIERAGGYTENAYLKGAVFTRESVRELQQKQLDEAIDRFEQAFLRGSITTVESTLTPEDARQQQAAMSQKASLIARMRSARAKGRISIKLVSLDRFKGSASDLVVENGDTVFIPETPSQVQVMGSVYNQTAFIYSKQDTVSTYLKKAGGLTRDADDDELYVLKVDGTAVSKRASAGGWGTHWDSDSNGWTGGSFMSSRLDPGDTVVAPEKIERIAWLKEVKDITQILYQIAVTAGVLIVAF